MKTATQDSLSPFGLFNAIVRQMPDDVALFFARLKSLRDARAFHPVVVVLNSMVEAEHDAWLRRDGDEPVMMKWFEIFRDIYVARTIADAQGEGVGDEASFTFFARTFEPLHLSPAFWFADTGLVKKPTFMAKAEALRLAFERFLCAAGGGGAWGAVDWEMESFAERKVRGGLQKSGAAALRRMAAIALTARAVLRRELNLSVDLRGEVTLPFAELSNERGNVCGLLKYFHFDNVTKLSFARARELGEEDGERKDRVRFEPRWDAMTVLADTIIRKSHARATPEASRRVMADTCLEFADLVCDEMASFGRKHPEVVKAAKALQRLFEEPRIATLVNADEKEILNELGVRDRAMAPDWYLNACGIRSAEQFWREAAEVFRRFVANFNLIYDSKAPLYSKGQLDSIVSKRGPSGGTDGSNVLETMLAGGQVSGVGKVLYPKALSSALRDLLSREVVEFNPVQLADVLAEENAPAPASLAVRHRTTKVTSELPFALLLPGGGADEVRAWMLDCLNALGAETYAPPPSKHGREKESPPYDYAKRDFTESIRRADSLWTTYFTRTDDCMKRYRLSMLQAEDILGKALKEGTYEVRSDESGIVGRVTNNPRLLKKLLADLREEMKAVDELCPIDMDKAQLEEYVGSRMKQDIIVDQVRDGEERVLIMLALVARIMVETAANYAELWQTANRDMLVAFIMHVLTATMKDPGLPFPWHLGWFSGSCMRAKLGRMKNRQWNVIDRWIKNAEFDDRAQAELLAMYLVHYLGTAPRPRQTLRAMRSCEVIRNWLGDERLEYLRTLFAEDRS